MVDYSLTFFILFKADIADTFQKNEKYACVDLIKFTLILIVWPILTSAYYYCVHFINFDHSFCCKNSVRKLYYKINPLERGDRL